MRLQDLEYLLPEHLIAQQPCKQRTDSRLLVVQRDTRTLSDQRFSDLPTLLDPHSVVVINNTRVLPAKFFLRRESGGLIEGLWLSADSDGIWQVLLRGGGRLRAHEVLRFEVSDSAHSVTVVERRGGGAFRLRVDPPAVAEEILERVGVMPLPHYIRRQGRELEPQDRQRYQTVFATQIGAIAAPTAGLHFDQSLMQSLRDVGIQLVEVTLHVGAGTFRPIEAQQLGDHTMHSESYSVSEDAWQVITRAAGDGRDIVAVGTTTTRVLETVVTTQRLMGETDLFIYPPYSFRLVNALITNFHLPRSSLLAMIYAFGTTELMREAYQHAVAQQYRFFSYGDAMLIL